MLMDCLLLAKKEKQNQRLKGRVSPVESSPLFDGAVWCLVYSLLSWGIGKDTVAVPSVKLVTWAPSLVIKAYGSVKGSRLIGRFASFLIWIALTADRLGEYCIVMLTQIIATDDPSV